MSDPDEPQSFQESWWCPDLISREKWRETIRVEFEKMLDMGVWRHVKRNDHPNDRRLVGCRWVFKVKIMVFTVPDLCQKVSAKFQVWISQTTIPQWLVMSHSELWWQE